MNGYLVIGVFTVILALSYGSREELTDATRRIALKVQAGELNPDEIEKETIDVNRLDKVFELAKADACQAQTISTHHEIKKGCF